MNPSPWPRSAARTHRGALYHRGRLDKPAVRMPGSSLEGPCLSCAPTRAASGAWRVIAELGSLPLWTLRRDGGFVLLDARKAPTGEFLRAAVKAGLLDEGVVFRVTSVDAETEEETFTDFATRAEAEANMEEGDRLSSRPGYLATSALNAYWLGQRGEHPVPVPVTLAIDAAVVAYADLHAPHVAGVIWRDRLDVARLSAPRVGLFQRTLTQVARTCN